jgi:uncharacterized membrane protein
LPFFLRFVPPTGAAAVELPAILRDVPIVPGLLSSVGPYRGERTSVGEFLTVFGVPYAVALWFVGGELVRRSRARTAIAVPRAAFLVVLGLLGLAVLLPAPVLALCGVPLAGALALLPGTEAAPRRVATGLFALGFALALVVELVYVRDVFDDRMNTLFKVYYQVWTLWAVAAALAIVLLWREARPRRLARPALAVFAALAVAAGAVYPTLASYRWTGEFADWQGLDGIAYVGRSEQPDELAAIRWLEANADPDDVLLEAAGCSYYPLGEVPFNRASAYSGVPTVIGWANHELQWRNGRAAWTAEIARRGALVGELFAEPSPELLDGYGVTLLFVGRYERARVDPSCGSTGPYAGVGEEGYPGAGWELAFDRGEVRIFRRSDGTTAASVGADRP